MQKPIKAIDATNTPTKTSLLSRSSFLYLIAQSPMSIITVMNTAMETAVTPL